MDDFLIAFGALWFVVCVCVCLLYRIRGIDAEADVSTTSLPWTGKEAFMSAGHVSAFSACYSHSSRRNARRRSQRRAARLQGRIVRSSRT